MKKVGGDVTVQNNSLFLSVFNWPRNGKLYLPGLNDAITSAKILEGTKSKKISFEKKNGWTILNVPYKPADSPVSVIQIDLGVKASTANVDTTLGIYPNIGTTLLAEFAEVTGLEKSKISWMEKFGEWKHVHQISNWEAGSKAVWTVDVFEPGYYYLDLRYKGEKRLVWNIVTDEGIVLQNQQAATEKYNNYNIGILEFKKPGKHRITVSLVEGNPATSSLEAVIIKPILE